MSAGTKTSTSKIALLLVLIPIGIGVWYLLPFALPMYRWTKVDFAKIAQATNQSAERLQTAYTMIVRYHPRGDGDPAPWQIVSSAPAWRDGDPEHRPDEFEVLVRCRLINDHNGKPPSEFVIGSSGPNDWKERYFRVIGWRFEGNAALSLPGPQSPRPVILYQGFSLERLPVREAMLTRGSIEDRPKDWLSDDTWPERDDQWEAPGSGPR